MKFYSVLDPSAVTSVYRPAKGSIISLKHHLSWISDLYLQHVRGKGRRNSACRTNLHHMSVTDHLCHQASVTAVLWSPGLEMVSVKTKGSSWQQCMCTLCRHRKSNTWQEKPETELLCWGWLYVAIIQDAELLELLCWMLHAPRVSVSPG